MYLSGCQIGKHTITKCTTQAWIKQINASKFLICIQSKSQMTLCIPYIHRFFSLGRVPRPGNTIYNTKENTQSLEYYLTDSQEKTLILS